jgi:hypothetical protein
MCRDHHRLDSTSRFVVVPFHCARCTKSVEDNFAFLFVLDHSTGTIVAHAYIHARVVEPQLIHSTVTVMLQPLVSNRVLDH